MFDQTSLDLQNQSSKDKKQWAIVGTVTALGAMFLSKYLYRRFRKVTRSFDKDTTRSTVAYRPTGQYSAGSTCFVNSCVQMLSSSRSFERYLRRIIPLVRTHALPTSLLQQSCDKIADIHDFNHIMSSENPFYYDGLQHDCQAFMQCVFGDVETLVEDSLKKHPSLDKQRYCPPYSCQEASSRVCEICQQTTKHTQKQSIISLSMFEQPSLTLEALFQQYGMSEYIDDARCEHCTMTKTLTLLEKEITNVTLQLKKEATKMDAFMVHILANKKKVEKLAETLPSKLQRMKREAMLLVKQQHEDYPESPYKLKKYIVNVEEAYFEHTKHLPRVVPLQVVRGSSIRTLQVHDYNECLIFHFKQLQGSRVKVFAHVAFPLQFALSSLDSSIMKTTEQDKTYTLTSIVVHFGNAYGGHYICYRRAGVTVSDEAAQRNRVYHNTNLPIYGDFTIEDDYIHVEGLSMIGDNQDLPPGKVYAPRIKYHTDQKQQYTWFRCSDTDITPVSEEEVLAAQPYMLLYEQDK